MGSASADPGTPAAGGAPRGRLRRRWIVIGAAVAVSVVAVAGVTVWLVAGWFAYDDLSSVHARCASRDFATQTPPTSRRTTGITASWSTPRRTASLTSRTSRSRRATRP